MLPFVRDREEKLLMVRRLLQKVNALSPILLNFLPKVISLSAVQSKKAYVPILVTLSGMVTLDNLLHPRKA